MLNDALPQVTFEIGAWAVGDKGEKGKRRARSPVSSINNSNTMALRRRSSLARPGKPR